MKIVMTHTDFRLYWQARIKLLQDKLSEKEHELIVVEIGGQGSPYAFSDYKVPTATFQWICLFPQDKIENIAASTAAVKLYAVLEALKPDAVLCGATAFTSGATAVQWAKQRNKAVIMFDNTIDNGKMRNPFVNYVKQVFYKYVDAVLCPSAAWIPIFKSWKFTESQLFFGVNTIDNNFWSGSSNRRTDLPSSFLLTVGRQIATKNFLLLLQAYKEYQHSCTNYLPLVMIGDGPENEKIRSFIQEGKLKDIHLFPFKQQEELKTFYHQATAFILPSLSETWGLVVNEAMAAGLPVLVSDGCGCVSTLVKTGINGYTFSPENKEDILRALIKFSQHSSEEKIQMGLSSKEFIKEWGLERFAEGALKAIQYASDNKKKCSNQFHKIILKSWNGRYRPI